MFSAIIPELTSITVFVLSLLSLIAGRSPGSLQQYSVISMNVTGLKSSYYTNTSTILPIPDVYNVHLTTYCQGDYHDGLNLPLVNVTCSRPSSFSKFLPSQLIANSLAKAHSNATLSSLAFPQQIQDSFISKNNLQLHVAFVFYIISLICTGTAVLLGILALIFGPIGLSVSIFADFASTCLLISSAIVTAVQANASGVISQYGGVNGFGDPQIQGSQGSGFLTLTWTAFALSFVSCLLWLIAGSVSVAVQSFDGF